MYIYIYAPSLVLVVYSVGSNTNNARTPPLAVHSQHVATNMIGVFDCLHDVTIYVIYVVYSWL